MKKVIKKNVTFVILLYQHLTLRPVWDIIQRMNNLINKGILYGLCLCFFLHSIRVPPTPFLTAIAVGSAALLFLAECLDTLPLAAALTAWGIFSLFIAPAACFLPIAVYDGTKPSFPRLVRLIVPLFTLLSFSGRSGGEILILLLLSGMAWLLRHYADSLEKSRLAFHQFRDDSTEQDLYLREKHQALLEKQNYEIHLATLRERNRIAREIHDSVGHLLTSSILQTGAIEVLNRDENLKQPIQNLSETLGTAMNSVRNSVHDLKDESVDLQKSLQDILRGASRLTGHLDYHVEREPDREIRFAFIAIAKEAVNNTERHSDADRVSIKVVEHPSFYSMKIADNGSTSKLPAEHGMGLENMEERIEALNGQIHFSAEQGFCIFISVWKDHLKKQGGIEHE